MGLLKKIFKPVSKVLDKIIPNEVKPFLPYAAAFAPYLGPMQGIMGIGGNTCLLYTSPSPRDGLLSRMPSSA